MSMLRAVLMEQVWEHWHSARFVHQCCMAHNISLLMVGAAL